MATSSSAQLESSAVFPPEKFEDEVNDEASGLMEAGQDPRIGSNNQEILGQDRGTNIHCVGWITLNALVGIIATAIVLSLYWEGHYSKAFPVEPPTRAPKVPASADAIPFVGSPPNQSYDVALVANTPDELVNSETQPPTYEETQSIDVGDDDDEVPPEQVTRTNPVVSEEEESPVAETPEEEVTSVAETTEAELTSVSETPEEEEPPVAETEPPVAEIPEAIALSETATEEFPAEIVPPADEEPPLPQSAQVVLEAYEYEHRAIAKQQIENFLNYGRAVLLNVIVAHHGASTVRREFQEFLPCPSFVCLHPTENDKNVHDNYPDYYPWSYNDTSINLAAVRGVPFRFLMWQFMAPPHSETSPQISDTNWEDPMLVSMFVIREPLSRALAGDAGMSQRHPTIFTPEPGTVATEEEWWAFAKEERHNNNFALRILSDSTCCQGAETPRHYLEAAKELIKRFTFVLDIECLDHGLAKLADTLGFEPARYEDLEDYNHRHNPKERIPYPEVYEYLVEKNKLDIELYEWAKTRALLNCEAVYAAEALAAEQQKEEEAALAAEQIDGAGLLTP